MANEESGSTTVTDPAFLGAEDILKEIDNDSKGTEDKAKTSDDHDDPDDEHEEEEEAEDDLEDEGEEGEKPEEEEDDGLEDEGKAEDKPTRLTLDPEIEKVLPPEVVKRWNQQAVGLERVQTELQGYADRWNHLTGIETRLADPQTAAGMLKQIVEYTVKQHGLDITKVLGVQTATPKEGEFEYEGDQKLFEATLKAAREQIMAEIGVNPADLKNLLAERQTASQQKAFESHVDQVAEITIKRCEKFDHGWKVTKAMVAEALKNLPQLKDTPAAAVRKWFSDERAAHIAEASVRSAPKGPEAIKGKGRVAKKLPTNPMHITAADILEDIGS